MNQGKEITYWAKVNYADEYLTAKRAGNDLTELEQKMETDEWTPVQLISQSLSISLVKIKKGSRKGFHNVIYNQFLVSEE